MRARPNLKSRGRPVDARGGVLLVGLLLLIGCGRSHAQRFEPLEASTGVLTIEVADGAEWFFSPDPDYLILQYHVVGGATEDALYPYLQLYGDGRVQVHRSAYRMSPGDHTMQLSDTEVNELLRSLVRHGILDFDKAAVTNQVNQAHDEYVARTGKYPFVTDAAVVSIEINLELYIPAGAGGPIENYHHRVSWSGVEHTAELYPSVEAIQGLRAAIQDLNAVARRAVRPPSR